MGNAAAEVTRTVRVWPRLAVSAVGYGTTTPDSGTDAYYPPNSVVNLVATGTAFSYFSGWTGDSVADSTASATTVTLYGAKSVAANFTEGYVMMLAVQGDGTVHYEDQGVPATVTEATGPVTVIVDDVSHVLSLNAEATTGVSEFWQWLSDDPAIDQTYVAESDFSLVQHATVTAVFTAENAVDFYTVNVQSVEGGTGTALTWPFGMNRDAAWANRSDLRCGIRSIVEAVPPFDGDSLDYRATVVYHSVRARHYGYVTDSRSMSRCSSPTSGTTSMRTSSRPWWIYRSRARRW